MDEEKLRTLAQTIANSLLTDGSGDKATRLLLVKEGDAYAQVIGGTYLGGLSERAVADRIINIMKHVE